MLNGVMDALINYVVVATGIVVWWLLRNKDAKQEEAIKLLFQKHDEDSKRLDDFQLEIAKYHYIKPELDAKFDKLEVAIKDSMDNLGKKFDRLSEILINGARKQ